MSIQEDSTREFDDSRICFIEAACSESMPIIEAYDGESFVFSDGIFHIDAL